jgi:hypothetical protein
MNLIGRTLILLTVYVVGCGHQRLTPEQQTLLTIHHVYAGIARYQDSLGRLPPTTSDVCHANMWWCFQDPGRWTLDGWDLPVQYQATDSGYQVRSFGPDKQPNTQDDLILTSRAERSLVRQFAGCYELSASLWREVNRSIALDSSVATPGEYRLLPQGRSERAVWFPLPGHQLMARWLLVPTYMDLSLSGTGDSLVGTARLGSDIGRDARKRIVAKRVPCVPHSTS